MFKNLSAIWRWYRDGAGNTTENSSIFSLI